MASKRMADIDQPEGQPADRQSLAHLSGGHRRWIVGLLLVGSIVLLVAGWITPIMTVEAFVFIGDKVSILDTVWRLLENGEVFLFVVLTVFSILFPIGKLMLALYLWFLAPVTRPGFLRTLSWIETLGKWSMLDVFVVALVVVALQISIVSDVALHAGIYLFTLAVTLSIGTVSYIAALAKRVAGSAADRRQPGRDRRP